MKGGILMPRPRAGGNGDGRMFFEGQYDPGYMFNPEFDNRSSNINARIPKKVKLIFLIILGVQFIGGLILHLLGLL